MKKILCLLILVQYSSIWAMTKQTLSQPSTSKSNSLEKLPREIRSIILQYVIGENFNDAVEGIKSFYHASPQSMKSVEINKAILQYLMEKFSGKFDTSKDLQAVVDKLSMSPVFKTSEMQTWIAKQKKALDLNAALRDAAREGNQQRVKDLIKEGANVNAFAILTPLLWAIKFKHDEVVKLLLENGADPNLAAGMPGNTSNHTPLMWAILWQDDPKTVELLIKKGARVNDQNINGETALIAAIPTNATTSELEKHYIKILLSAGANPNIVAKNVDRTVLGALVLQYDQGGVGTPIQNEILDMLLAKHANPNLGKLYNRSILKYVREFFDNADELKQKLIKAGATE